MTSLNMIGGEEISLGEFRNKKLLIVNVASQCGFTKQYAQLQELYCMYRERLAILGCPCNDFGQQEPDSNEEIIDPKPCFFIVFIEWKCENHKSEK